MNTPKSISIFSKTNTLSINSCFDSNTTNINCKILQPNIDKKIINPNNIQLFAPR